MVSFLILFVYSMDVVYSLNSLRADLGLDALVTTRTYHVLSIAVRMVISTTVDQPRTVIKRAHSPPAASGNVNL